MLNANASAHEKKVQSVDGQESSRARKWPNSQSTSHDNLRKKPNVTDLILS